MILKDVNLQPLNTMACESHAEWGCYLDQLSDLPKALAWARERNLTVRILGEGSNLLPARRVSGLTLINRLQGVRIVRDEGNQVTVDVASGVNWHWWVCFSSAQGWHGLENLALIPGTVGAAPVQNIGAYGTEVETYVESLLAVHLVSGEQRRFDKSECGFGYRDSVFKGSEAGCWFIQSVRFVLPRSFNPVLTYRPLDEMASPTPRSLIDTVVAVRQSKLPNPRLTPNAGSFFTNPVVSRADAEEFLARWPDAPSFIVDEGSNAEEGAVKIAAGWLIDQAGWKGYQDPETGVGPYEKQALVITNPQHRARDEVLACSQRIQQDIAHRFGLQLHREPQLFGD